MLSKTPTDDLRHPTTRLDLPLVLPDVPDARDACIARLTSMLEAQPGVVRVHVLDVGDTEPGETRPITSPMLCMHYDAERVTLAEGRRFRARRGGRRSVSSSRMWSCRYIASRLRTTACDSSRCSVVLRGVTAAAVSMAAQVARVEFDRRITSRANIEAVLQETRKPDAREPDGGESDGGEEASRSWYARKSGAGVEPDVGCRAPGRMVGRP
jgi:hypothetical protein